MAEQADRLKDWIGQYRQAPQKTGTPGKQVLALTSGKGGVGKTHLAVNLSIMLQARRQRVLLMDADLGMANAHLLYGAAPAFTLWDVVRGKVSLREAVYRMDNNVSFIAGGSGIAELAQLSFDEITRIIRGFRDLEREYDWLVIDTGAGISTAVLAFVQAADAVLVVVVPEPSALTDAYGLIKSVWAQGSHPVWKLCVNRVANPKQAAMMGHRLVLLTDKALHQSVELLGLVREDHHVFEAALRQQPLVQSFPHSLASQDIGQLADRLLGQVPVEGSSQGFGGFFSRLASHWGKALKV
ncbi:MAG: AAA family ATPase [Firmicutes bacterium]|nr:AAA family ATPase [Bacillota bacterium]